MGSALHMSRPTTFTGDLALFFWVHRCEPTPPAFPFRHHCDPPLIAKLKMRSLGSAGCSRLGA
jgi:hypothetical protein